MGRPSIYSAKIAEAICERLANGEPLARICDGDQMPSYSTVNKWLVDKPDFLELSTRAKRHGTHKLADDCVIIADGELPDDPEVARVEVQHRKLKIDTRIRLIGKWNRQDYGDKTLLGSDPENPLPEGFNVRLLGPSQPDEGR